MTTSTQHTTAAPTQVCVIIAAYNAQKTITRAIMSALEQPEVSEIFVVDDASTDQTSKEAQSINDPSKRLKILIQTQNLGPSAARNRAIAESTSPWLAILDADDFFLPNRIKTLLSKCEQADFIADNMWQVPEDNLDAPRISLLENPPQKPTTISFTDFVLSNITQAEKPRAELGFIKPLMRRSFLQRNRLHYQEHMRLGEDYELYTRALGLGARMILVPEHGYVSVVRANSLSGNHSETDLLHLRDCNQSLLETLPLNQQCKHALRRNYLSIDCRLQWRLLIAAVKKRNLTAIIKPFLRPWPVPLYLAKQLAQQIMLRSKAKFT